ncbi:MAG: glycoside hydrolase [Pseudanabaenaceae cyanobacterium]
MIPLYVALIWHQHQPLYKSPALGTGVAKYRMPWVRLHGIKDYLDLLLLLERFPSLHQTVNLVPSLMLQLQEYADGYALDPYLELSLLPVSALQESQKRLILERFFDANVKNMILVHDRYSELYGMRQTQGMAWCLEHWQAQDWEDLLAWHNLAWFDPLFQLEDREIARWIEQGRGFSLSDRQRICAKQREIIQRILPHHQLLQKKGQIEVTTTPYTHPILPLLIDSQVARVALPQMLLPGVRFRWEGDVHLQLEKAKQVYRYYFQCEPRGLWPSEQSVSPSILPHVARHGFNWLCSDEGVLGWSLGHYFRRDERGNLLEPHLLYQPYKLETIYGDLGIVFRDHRLSDLIGFTYGNMSAVAAADDFSHRLAAIYQQFLASDSDRPWLVTIALDGENCWEFYARDGMDFLLTLYKQLAECEYVRMVTVSEYLAQFPPVEKIPPHQLHSGSWIDASFSTWIGDPVKNRAWELLAEARQVLASHPEATIENNPEAWEHLLAAEGSDWFWWLGAGHTSPFDALFDQLFREHLQAVYRALNEPVPSNLLYPLEPHDLPTSDRPLHFIHPEINGKLHKEDWWGAARLEIGGERGTMHQTSLVQSLWYGWDHFGFYLRLDLSSTALIPAVRSTLGLHLLWFYPEQTKHISPAPIADLPDVAPLNYLFHHHLAVNLGKQDIKFYQALPNYQWRSMPHQAQIAIDECLELAVPWQTLGVNPRTRTALVIMLTQDDLFYASLPECTIIPLDVP